MVRIARPFVTNADESPAYWQIGNLWQVLATGVQTDNAFTLLDQIVHDGGGGGPVTHAHTQDEGLYVISGRCTFNAGGRQGLPGTPGTFVAIPGNTEHSFTVDEPDTHILNFYLPAGFEQLLIGIARPALERKPPPPELIEEMIAPPWLADKLSEDYGETSVLGNPFVDKPDPDKMMTRATPGATIFPFTANRRNLNSYFAMGGTWTVLADGKQTGGSYCLLEVFFEKGLAVDSRIYKDRDEILYVLSGNLTLMLGSRIVTAAQGSMVFIPSGTVYNVAVNSEEAHCLNLHTRSGFEELIELCGTPVTSDSRQLAADAADKFVDAGARVRLLDKIGLQELPGLRTFEH